MKFNEQYKNQNNEYQNNTKKLSIALAGTSTLAVL